MKRTIRVNGQVKEIDCEFGLGIFDKDRREIIEGDVVIDDNEMPSFRERKVACLRDGNFIFVDERDIQYWNTTADGELANYDSIYRFKIVGHIDLRRFEHEA